MSLVCVSVWAYTVCGQCVCACVCVRERESERERKRASGEALALEGRLRASWRGQDSGLFCTSRQLALLMAAFSLPSVQQTGNKKERHIVLELSKGTLSGCKQRAHGPGGRNDTHE